MHFATTTTTGTTPSRFQPLACWLTKSLASGRKWERSQVMWIFTSFPSICEEAEGWQDPCLFRTCQDNQYQANPSIKFVKQDANNELETYASFLTPYFDFKTKFIKTLGLQLTTRTFSALSWFERVEADKACWCKVEKKIRLNCV